MRPTPFTSAGAASVDFVALLLLGRQRGYLTPDDVVVVLESVELNAALIDAVVGRVRAEGIEWRDDIDADDGLDLRRARSRPRPRAPPSVASVARVPMRSVPMCPGRVGTGSAGSEGAATAGSGEALAGAELVSDFVWAQPAGPVRAAPPSP